MPKKSIPNQLTEKFCKEVETEKRFEFPDGEGLYLGVMETGHKSWSYRFRFNGVNSRYVIGPYPEISLREARLEKKRLIKILKQGQDPAEFVRRSKVIEYERARWLHKGCGYFMNMMPQNVRIEVVQAALAALRCPFCGKGPEGIKVAKRAREVGRK